MNPLSLLWQKVLAAAAGVLLLTSLGLGIALALARADRDRADAFRDTAVEGMRRAETERDAYKIRAGELDVANGAWSEAFRVQGRELERAQKDVVRLQREGQAAIAAAQAAAADADRTLKQFVDRFARESREPDCASALLHMEAKCSALSDY